MRSATPSGRIIRADDWICTSIVRFTKPPPRCSATSAISRSARIRTPLGGFGDRFLSQEDTPVSAPGLATGDLWRNHYSRSVTFQYASLRNFDQLSIRNSWSAYSGFHVGRTGFFRRCMLRLLRRPVGLPLVAGHAGQHAVLPARHTALRTRDNVVQRQFLAARLGTAVLAGVVVPLENVPAAEGHMGRRQPVVAVQGDYLRHPQLETEPPG